MPITRIVVAHRPALIRRADRIFVVKDRQISETLRLDCLSPEVLSAGDPLRGLLSAGGRQGLLHKPLMHFGKQISTGASSY
jgi:hypothetical protein